MSLDKDLDLDYKDKEDYSKNEPSDGKSYVDGYLVSVKFSQNPKPYYFHSHTDDYVLDEAVVVETVRGLELGHVAKAPIPVSEYKQALLLKPLIRKASKKDLDDHARNLENAKHAFKVCKESISNYNLDMHLLKAEYTLDGNKIIFNYSAEARVDFRELLKDLANRLKSRIELRQIGARDRAKLIGGIGICGLPLCCNTFLGEFDAISINMAKNQFLVLNIQKLSGHCGKLLCCLKYEDNDYSEMRKGLPRIGQKFIFENESFKVASINVLTKQVKIESKAEVKFLKLDEVLDLINKQAAIPQV